MDTQIPLQQQPRLVLNRCLADLAKERFLLLHQFKLQSLEVVSIDSRICILRKLRDELFLQAQKAN